MNARMFKSFVKTAMELQADQDTPGDYAATRAAVEAMFPKLAGFPNALELGGLGTLAAPAVSNMAGHPMSEKNKDRAEVAGLGVLAAPYAHNAIAGQSARYANSGVGKKLTSFFGHAHA